MRLPMVLFVQHHLPIPRNDLGLVSGLSIESISPERRAMAMRCSPDCSRHGHPTVAFTSSLPRNLETVGPWLEGTGVPILVDDRLTALDYGQLADANAAEVGADLEMYIDDPMPGGESVREKSNRFASFLEEVGPMYEGRDVLIMAHAVGPTVLLHLCLGFTLAEAARLEQETKARTQSLRASGMSEQAAIDMSYADSELRGPFPWPPSADTTALQERRAANPLLGTFTLMEDA
jgi:broad specificity phosphatase PhoE